MQLLLLVVLPALLTVAVSRFEVEGAAHFVRNAWLLWWSVTLAVVFVVWACLSRVQRSGRVAAWLALWTWAVLPPELVGTLLSVAQTRALFIIPSWLAWAIYAALWLWVLGASLATTRAFVPNWHWCVVVVLPVLALQALAEFQLPNHVWRAKEDADSRPTLHLSQAVFEQQQNLLAQQLSALQSSHAGGIHVYGLVFAPFADDVFLRESQLTSSVLQERFDAQVMALVNHANAAKTYPWATPENLRKSIGVIAQKMNRSRDVLVVYMTSHGGADFHLAAEFEPLAVNALTAPELKAWLDEAGIQNRVLLISACFSGGWLAPLSDPHTLVMTAADATHTSYGCGYKSELTFFGRALWDEQLRRTHSFTEAYAKAVPLIKQRETEAGKDDGFSNPQLQVGKDIKPVLERLQYQLDLAPHPAPSPNQGSSGATRP